MEEELQERLENEYKSCIKISVEYKDIRTYEIKVNLLTNEIIQDEIDHSIKLMRIAEILSGNKPIEYKEMIKLEKEVK